MISLIFRPQLEGEVTRVAGGMAGAGPLRRALLALAAVDIGDSERTGDARSVTRRLVFRRVRSAITVLMIGTLAGAGSLVVVLLPVWFLLPDLSVSARRMVALIAAVAGAVVGGWWIQRTISRLVAESTSSEG